MLKEALIKKLISLDNFSEVADELAISIVESNDLFPHNLISEMLSTHLQKIHLDPDVTSEEMFDYIKGLMSKEKEERKRKRVSNITPEGIEDSKINIVDFLKKNPNATRQNILSATGLPPRIIRLALTALIAEGRLMIIGEKRNATYSVAE